MRIAESVGAVREREREREVTSKKIDVSFLNQKEKSKSGESMKYLLCFFALKEREGEK